MVSVAAQLARIPRNKGKMKSIRRCMMKWGGGRTWRPRDCKYRMSAYYLVIAATVIIKIENIVTVSRWSQ
jgi:hypothetical protein